MSCKIYYMSKTKYQRLSWFFSGFESSEISVLFSRNFLWWFFYNFISGLFQLHKQIIYIFNINSLICNNITKKVTKPWKKVVLLASTSHWLAGVNTHSIFKCMFFSIFLQKIFRKTQIIHNWISKSCSSLCHKCPGYRKGSLGWDRGWFNGQ